MQKIQTYFLGFIAVMMLAVIAWGMNELKSEEKKAAIMPPAVVQETPVHTAILTDPGLMHKDFPSQLVRAGIIDREKLSAISIPTLGQEALLAGTAEKKTIILGADDQFMLNMLWGLGLAQENKYLSELHQMARAGELERLASTGGWTIAQGTASDHFSRHNFLNLTDEQQKRVADMAATMYRPCCGNHARFADCNHGMAMIGMLSLGAAQGLSDQQLYTLAAAFNKTWFPDNYANIERYMQMVEKKNADSAELVSARIASSAGYKTIMKQLAAIGQRAPQQNAGGCSLGAPQPQQRLAPGCSL